MLQGVLRTILSNMSNHPRVLHSLANYSEIGYEGRQPHRRSICTASGPLRFLGVLKRRFERRPKRDTARAFVQRPGDCASRASPLPLPVAQRGLV